MQWDGGNQAHTHIPPWFGNFDMIDEPVRARAHKMSIAIFAGAVHVDHSLVEVPLPLSTLPDDLIAVLVCYHSRAKEKAACCV